MVLVAFLPMLVRFQNKWKVNITNKYSICLTVKVKALGILLTAFSLFSCIAWADEPIPTYGYPTEMQNLELAVAAMMADRDNPAIDISNDPQITLVPCCRTGM